MRVEIIVKLTPKQIHMLEKIGRKGNASNGYSQDFEFSLNKAINDFVSKYEFKKEARGGT